jgi:hypothetical protein
MNEYFIEHGIKTLARLYEPFEFRGYRFEQWDYTPAHGPVGDAWRASKIMVARDIDDALRNFSLELASLIDRIAFVSQCFTMVEVQPFFILKLNENEDRVLFAYYSKERRGVPLHFSAKEQEALAELEKYEEKGDVFRLLRESTNATRFYTRFVMLVAALEAMAGERADTYKVKR